MALLKVLEERRQKVIEKRRDKLKAAAHEGVRAAIQKKRDEERNMLHLAGLNEEGRDLTFDDISLASLEMPLREKRYPWFESDASSSKSDAVFGGRPSLMRSPSFDNQLTAHSFRMEKKGRRRPRHEPLYQLIKSELDVIWESPDEGYMSSPSSEKKRHTEDGIFIEVKRQTTQTSSQAAMREDDYTKKATPYQESFTTPIRKGMMTEKFESLKSIFRKKDIKGKGRAVDPID